MNRFIPAIRFFMFTSTSSNEIELKTFYLHATHNFLPPSHISHLTSPIFHLPSRSTHFTPLQDCNTPAQQSLSKSTMAAQHLDDATVAIIKEIQKLSEVFTKFVCSEVPSETLAQPNKFEAALRQVSHVMKRVKCAFTDSIRSSRGSSSRTSNHGCTMSSGGAYSRA
jgi:hypothetical protein